MSAAVRAGFRFPSLLHTCYCLSDSGHPGAGGWVSKSRLDSCDSVTVAHQAPLSVRFPRQEDWSGMPFPSPRDLPDPGVDPRSQRRGLGLISGQGAGTNVRQLRLVAAK